MKGVSKNVSLEIMGRWAILLIVAGLSIMLVASCMPTASVLNTQIAGTALAQPSVTERPAYRVYRYTDDEAGVVCWLYGTQGISCLPVSQTELVP